MFKSNIYVRFIPKDIKKDEIENEFKKAGPISSIKLKDFEHKTKPIFEMIEIKANENQKLSELKDLLLAKMTRVESEKLIKI